jgi:hypothetical protein
MVALALPNQTAVTVRRGTGAMPSAEVPTWHPGQAITAPRVAWPSQHGQGSVLSRCCGFAEATTTAGNATQNIAAKRARVPKARVANAITNLEYWS